MACRRAEAHAAAQQQQHGCGLGRLVSHALPIHFPHHPPPLQEPQAAMQALQLPKAVFGPAADEMLLRCVRACVLQPRARAQISVFVPCVRCRFC
jgi:hypothetical protein